MALRLVEKRYAGMDHLVPKFLPKTYQRLIPSQAPGTCEGQSGEAFFQPNVITTAWWSLLDALEKLQISLLFSSFFLRF